MTRCESCEHYTRWAMKPQQHICGLTGQVTAADVVLRCPRDETRVARVGDRGRHVAIPDGWVRVPEGVCFAGDRFLQAPEFRFKGRVQWCEVEDDFDVGEDASTFDLLIRKES